MKILCKLLISFCMHPNAKKEHSYFQSMPFSGHIFSIMNVHPWLIHVNVWQNLLKYRKVISLQLKQINFKKW